MEFTNDPNDRPRIDREAMNERDADVWRRRHQGGQTVRQIARALGIPASTVQRCYARASKRAAALAAPEQLPAMMFTELTAEDVAGNPDQWPRCNALERYRLRHQPQALALVVGGHRIPPVHDDDHAQCCIAHGLDPDWSPDSHSTVSHPWPPDEPDDW